MHVAPPVVRSVVIVATLFTVWRRDVKADAHVRQNEVKYNELKQL